MLLQDTIIAVLFISVVMTPCSFVKYCLPTVFNTPCLLLFYFQSFHTSFAEFHVLVFTTNVYKYWIATWYLMPSEGAPIQKINHIESSFLGLCKAVRNAIADSPTGRSLQSLYMAPAYICLVQIFALLFPQLISSNKSSIHAL